VSDNPYRSSLCAHVTMGTEPHEVMMTDCADGTYLFSRHWRVCSGVLLQYVQQIRVFTLQLSAERMATSAGTLGDATISIQLSTFARRLGAPLQLADLTRSRSWSSWPLHFDKNQDCIHPAVLCWHHHKFSKAEHVHIVSQTQVKYTSVLHRLAQHSAEPLYAIVTEAA
jgi:hypothetical protein